MKGDFLTMSNSKENLICSPNQLDYTKRNFDVTKAQLAHDLTMFKLLKLLDGTEDMSVIYDTYENELQHTKAVIEDKTRYELEQKD